MQQCVDAKGGSNDSSKASVIGDVLRTQPMYAVVRVNNVLTNRREAGPDRVVAYPRPQVIIRYYDGFTGDLMYAESILGGS